jgi:hypothetical protein
MTIEALEQEHPVFKMKRGACPITTAIESEGYRRQRYDLEVRKRDADDRELTDMKSAMEIIHLTFETMTLKRSRGVLDRELRCRNLELEWIYTDPRLAPPHLSNKNG